MTETVTTERRPMREELPCGCYSAVTRRMVPAFDPTTGYPKVDADGKVLEEEHEEVEEGYCAEHSVVVHERMLEANRALAEGRDPSEALAAMAGIGHPALPSAGAEIVPLLGDDRNGGDE
jgi:hypothetical protein